MFPPVEALHAPRGYSHVAVARGATIHIAGQVAVDTEGRTVGVGDFAAQARAAFVNVATALSAAGSGVDAIAALTIYCDASVARSELRHLRDLWGPTGPPVVPPAMTLIFVSGLLDPEWLIEIQAVAVGEPPIRDSSD